MITVIVHCFYARRVFIRASSSSLSVARSLVLQDRQWAGGTGSLLSQSCAYTFNPPSLGATLTRARTDPRPRSSRFPRSGWSSVAVSSKFGCS